MFARVNGPRVCCRVCFCAMYNIDIKKSLMVYSAVVGLIMRSAVVASSFLVSTDIKVDIGLMV